MIINNANEIKNMMDSVSSFEYMIVDAEDMSNKKCIWISMQKEFAVYTDDGHIDHIETSTKEELQNMMELITAWGELSVLDATMYKKAV